MLRKLLFAVAVCFGMYAVAEAEPISVDVGGLTLVLPFQEVGASQLYDFDAGRGFAAVETNLVKKGDGALVFGGATSTAGNPAFPYIGFNFRLPSPPFDISNNELTFGAWIGRDFGTDKNFFGIKGSVDLF